MDIDYDNAVNGSSVRCENKLDNDYIGGIMISKYQFLKYMCAYLIRVIIFLKNEIDNIKIIRVKIFIFSKKSSNKDFIFKLYIFNLHISTLKILLTVIASCHNVYSSGEIIYHVIRK